MVIFAKAENALKRAEELVNVGQKQAGLQVLHDVITSKRYRTWQKTLESIMFKYVELCVDMRRGRFAKDGLIQYRIVCQQVNVGSLEEVVKYFLRLSTEKVKQAQAKVQASEIALDVEDLEAEKRPEDLMMSFVSGEKGKDRSDKEVVTPWFKFLWETYRIVLDILRNNSKLEALYAMTAHRAFQFCLQYKRTTEFRRLCEIIRNHLSNLNKYKDQRDRPDLALPESLQLYLDTRIEQLKVATELELWQEAFRSIEDIHGLMCMVKKTPKPQTMAVYYTKLSKIFWVAESHLYHAYAWYKLYTLQKSYNKNLTQKDLQLMASNVLLAALSVMPYDQKHGTSRFAVEKEKERTLKMANLLGFNLDSKKDANEELSRSALLSELVSKGLMSYVPQEVRDLYHLLEKESHPLDLAAKVEPLLAKLSKISDKLSAASPVPEALLEQYVPALERLTALRVLQQTSEVYQTMKISALKSMIPFFDFTVFEKLCAEGARFNFVQIKIDHLKGVVLFGKKNLESDNIKYQLTVLAERLNKARLLINLPSKKQNKITDTTTLLLTIEKEHKKLLARKLLIEKRKEEQERQMLEKEREEETKRLQIQRMTEEAEQKRLHAEAIRRQEMRIKKEIEEKEQQEVQDIIHEQEKKKGKKSKKSGIEGEKLVSKKDVIEQVLNEQLKERQERERKLQKLAKTMDYLERAKREEEGPLIEAAYQKRLVEDKIFFEQQQEQAIEQSKLQHAADLAEKNRLMRMMDDKVIFQEEIVSRRKGEFERLKRERESRLAERCAVRKLDRERRRKMEYYRRQEEERLRRQKEEEEARKKEVEERKRKEEAERTAKLNEMAEKQRMRELEIEERARQREAQAREQAVAEPSRPQKFVPRHLRQPEAVAVPVAQEAATDSWRDRRPVVPRDNDVNVPPAPDRNAPPRARYEPPLARSEPFRAPRDNPPGARPAAPGRGREDRAFGSGFGARDDRGFGGRGGFGGRDDRGFGSSDRWRGANDRDKQRDEPGSSSWRK